MGEQGQARWQDQGTRALPTTTRQRTVWFKAQAPTHTTNSTHFTVPCQLEPGVVAQVDPDAEPPARLRGVEGLQRDRLDDGRGEGEEELGRGPARARRPVERVSRIVGYRQWAACADSLVVREWKLA